MKNKNIGRVVAMIPARLDSVRFPGKLLKDLGGKSVIWHTYEATIKTELFDDVYVVTDSNEIYDEINNQGGKVIYSDTRHSCGSDRIAEAVENMDVDIVVNVQGDEPFTSKAVLEDLLKVFETDIDKKIDLATPKIQLTDDNAIKNPNNVKVVSDNHNFALYFSRSQIPFPRDRNQDTKYYKHVGIYAFRKQALMDFSSLAMKTLEATEKIECIRFLEYGHRIKMVETFERNIGIDTAEDLEEARKFLLGRPRPS